MREFNFAAIHGTAGLKAHQAPDDLVARYEIALDLHQTGFKSLTLGDADQHIHIGLLARAHIVGVHLGVDVAHDKVGGLNTFYACVNAPLLKRVARAKCHERAQLLR